jgi:hypothetical protein
MRRSAPLLLALFVMTALTVPANAAEIDVGAHAPDFFKKEITTSGPSEYDIHLYDYTDKKALLLYVFGAG